MIIRGITPLGDEGSGGSASHGGIARFERVTKRRINQPKKQYKAECIIPQLKDPGRKKKSVSPACERIILDMYLTYQSGPVLLKKIHGVAISHNTIYQVMMMHQLVVENSRKMPEKLDTV